MNIYFKTPVEQELTKVISAFNADLFMKLSPPFPPVKLERFDGSKTGDYVIIELNFLLFKQKWVSYINYHHQKTGEYKFVDIGKKLPFFLKKWEHQHLIKSNHRGGCDIIDYIYFSTGTLLTDLLIYPALFIQFWYRKPIYKKVFKN